MRSARQLLYISPYFPPLCRVGALRSLKFCRHLDAVGWRAHVLCDFHPGYTLDATLLDAVPAEVCVHRTYGLSARLAGRQRLPAPGNALAPRAPRSYFPSEDRVPLGHHLLDLAHALRAGEDVLRREPCDAILVNADPYAALLVGARLARRFRIPLVADLRDPWALCTLRRPRRGRPQRWATDALEALVMRRASRVILNTERTRHDYAAHYPEHAHKLNVIRNHSDPELIGTPTPIAFDRFTLLFAGSLRRDLEGQPLLAMLRALRQRGVTPEILQLAMPSGAARAFAALAAGTGLDAFIRPLPHTPYRSLGALLRAADVLVSLTNAGQQRIPAKIYDYLAAPRPVLAIADTAELAELLRDVPGSRVVGLSNAAAASDFVLEQLARGRQRELVRPARFGSREATEQLGSLLNEACAEGSTFA